MPLSKRDAKGKHRDHLKQTKGSLVGGEGVVREEVGEAEEDEVGEAVVGVAGNGCRQCSVDS